MSFWNSIFTKRSEDWTFSRLQPDQVPDEPKQNLDIAPNSGYLTIQVKSFRVVNVRKLTKKFYGMIHSRVSMLNIGGPDATFQTVSTPSELKLVDPRNLDRVITTNITLAKNTPYRGGEVNVQIGLFSVEEADLAGPFIDLLTDLANTAGVGIVKAALPFVEPIKKGVDAIVGSNDGSILEIGYATTLNPPKTGWFVIMRAPKEKNIAQSLKVTPDDFRLVQKSDNQPVKDCPYFVFTVSASRENPEWYKISYLAESYKKLQDAIAASNIDSAKEQFAIFKRAALTSDDLIREDAERLCALVEEKLKVILTSGLVAKAKASSLENLEQIQLYP